METVPGETLSGKCAPPFLACSLPVARSGLRPRGCGPPYGTSDPSMVLPGRTGCPPSIVFGQIDAFGPDARCVSCRGTHHSLTASAQPQGANARAKKRLPVVFAELTDGSSLRRRDHSCQALKAS